MNDYTMKFTKMHGIGNDYVYVDCTKEMIPNPSKVARYVSNRHFGIGSDGMILIRTSDKADFFMEMYNADGSEGMMCGNGIRCVAKYVYDNGLTDRHNVAIETRSGIKYIQLNIGDDNKVISARVNMGAPVLDAGLVPVRLPGRNIAGILTEDIVNAACNVPITVSGKEYNVTCVSMGNPHCIVYVDDDFDMEGFKIEEVGPYFENHELFPERINTEFVRIKDRQNLVMRVWERGSGETLACGTGACASLVATVLNGLCDDTATVHLRGGDLKITWNREDGMVYMEGTAVKVFEGEIDISKI